jgi:hypothetical protein
MPESVEAKYLRENWNALRLSQYKNKWIAVEGSEIVGSGGTLSEAMEDQKPGKPLYAFVLLGRVQRR